MARIIDKDTRIIDVDFGPVSVTIQRDVNAEFPTAGQATFGNDGINQFIRSDDFRRTAGSFIQFQRIDLDYMTMNNEVMQPMEVNVQRTNAVPTGQHENGNNFSPIVEYLFIFTRPLANPDLPTVIDPYLNTFSNLGLNLGTANFTGDSGGITLEQNVYAEQRIYQWSSAKLASLANGDLAPGGPLNSYAESPTIETVNTWGSLSAITGPNLYCYRVFHCQAQGFPAGGAAFQNVNQGGLTTLRVPPVSVKFLCRDPKYTEGQYLTRLANAMSNLPIDGEASV
tara:strand:+ start:274 stop:1122 length:849 start_codon:yes stop_codon:yes gene_type:complete